MPSTRTVKTQQSFGPNGVEGESSVDRFYAIGLSYNNARTEWNTVIDSTNFASYGTGTDPDDSLVITTGVRHDIDIAKIYFDAQYFQDARDFTVADLQQEKWLQDQKGQGRLWCYCWRRHPSLWRRNLQGRRRLYARGALREPA